MITVSNVVLAIVMFLFGVGSCNAVTDQQDR